MSRIVAAAFLTAFFIAWLGEWSPRKETIVKLGKKPPKVDERTLRLAKYLDTRTAPKPPKTCDWSRPVKSWPMMLNDNIGDCTIAAAGHMVQCWTANAGDEELPTDDAVLKAYEALTGYNPATGANDDGCYLIDVLNYWRQTGIGQHKIAAYAKVDTRNRDEVLTAAWLFGGLDLGLAMPAAWKGKKVWSSSRSRSGKWEPGSWGGHSVPIVEFGPHGVRVVTWGGLVLATWDAFETYCDEAYVALSEDWLCGDGSAPSGFDWEALVKDLAEVTGQDVGPVNPPAPQPPPNVTELVLTEADFASSGLAKLNMAGFKGLTLQLK